MVRRLFVICLGVLLCVPATAAAAPAKRAFRAASLPAVAPVAPDALTRSLDSGELTEAEYALQRALTLSDLARVRAEFGDVRRPHPRAATLILRDLKLRLRSLSGSDLEQARALMARPTDSGGDGVLEYTTAEADPVCTINVCVHYVTASEHAASPAFVASVSAIMEEVWTTEVTTFGWRPPKSDLNTSDNGGDGRLDVYLGDIGTFAYGYCQSTEPGRLSAGYCVLDNDFSPEQFPSTSGIEAAKVTAAHEFNHAIQANYNDFTDAWLVEATATWMEDEVYDSIDDNHGYVSEGPLGHPDVPADTAGEGELSLFQYGSFIWMNYLSEKFGSRDVVRNVWERGMAGSYSTEAIAGAVASRGSDFASSFADFTARNVDASGFYAEGAAYEEWQPPVRSVRHSVGAQGVSGTATGVDHLSARFVSFSGGSSSDQLTISVDMTDTANGSRATLVGLGGSSATYTPIPLDTTGAGTAMVPFSSEVVLVLTNAGRDMNNCSLRGTEYACGGQPAFDDQTFGYSAAIGSTAPTPPPSVDGGAGVDAAPRITNLRAAPNPFVAGRKTKILFTIDEAAKLKMVIAKSTGTKIGAWAVQIPEGGDWYTVWNGKDARGRLVSRGTYRIKLTPMDSSGNVGATATTSVKVK